MNNNMRYKPEHSLSQDEKGKTSQDTAFRGSTLLTPITVTTSRVAIPASWFRTSMILYNAGTGDIYIGDDTVTATNGIPIAAGEKFGVTIGSKLPVCVISGGSEVLRGWELG